LNEEFGKEISSALCNIGDESTQLNHYFYKKIKPYLLSFYDGPIGAFLDLSKGMPKEDLELKFLIRHFFRKCNLLISSQILEVTQNLIRSSAANKSICFGNSALYIDRSRLFFPKTKLSWDNDVPIKIGKQTFGIWTLEAEIINDCEQELFSSNWQSAWQGECLAFLPCDKEYVLASCLPKECYPRSSPIGKLWNASKVPAFLRESFPVVYHRENIVHEFMTGKQGSVFSKHQKVLKLLLKVNK